MFDFGQVWRAGPPADAAESMASTYRRRYIEAKVRRASFTSVACSRRTSACQQRHNKTCRTRYDQLYAVQWGVHLQGSSPASHRGRFGQFCESDSESRANDNGRTCQRRSGHESDAQCCCWRWAWQKWKRGWPRGCGKTSGGGGGWSAVAARKCGRTSTTENYGRS